MISGVLMSPIFKVQILHNYIFIFIKYCQVIGAVGLLHVVTFVAGLWNVYRIRMARQLCLYAYTDVLFYLLTYDIS